MIKFYLFFSQNIKSLKNTNATKYLSFKPNSNTNRANLEKNWEFY